MSISEKPSRSDNFAPGNSKKNLAAAMRRNMERSVSILHGGAPIDQSYQYRPVSHTPSFVCKGLVLILCLVNGFLGINYREIMSPKELFALH
jgi:hypothetical protein